MSAQETDARLANEAARIKRSAIQRNARSNWVMGVALLAAVIVSVAVWFIPNPMDRDANHAVLAIGSGMFTLLFGALLGRFLFPLPNTECPKCGCDWKVESENDLQKWLSWKCCPLCGLKMPDDTDSNEKP
jgi:hypothetical protein